VEITRRLSDDSIDSGTDYLISLFVRSLVRSLIHAFIHLNSKTEMRTNTTGKTILIIVSNGGPII